MTIKTATFWLCEMTADERRLLEDVRKSLGEAQRAMVCEWLTLAIAEKPYGENAGKQKGRKVFADTPYSNDLVNNYAHADAHTRFKEQWKAVRRGERSSVSFAGDAPFIFVYSPQHVTVEEHDGKWWLIAPRIFGGRKKADREKNQALRWQLDPVDNRRTRWCLDLLERAKRIVCVRLMPSEKKPGKWLAKVSVELPELHRVEVEKKVYTGIDVGINCPAVLSIPDRGFVRFFGREREQYPRLWQKIADYEERKAKLHRAGKHAAARKLRDNISNVRRHINECISRHVADLCRVMRVTHLRMENLKGMTRHKSMKGKLRHWPRYHLQERIEQKCKEVGIEVERVRAAGTSYTCSYCGSADKDNRHGAAFRCLVCGFERHADVNAANNIARALKSFGPCEGMSALDEADELRFVGLGQEPAPRQGKATRLIG